MTQDEWTTCTEPQAMLQWLRERGGLSDRKARLFAVACCAPLSYLLRDKRSQRAIRASEAYAEGQLPAKRMSAVREAARRAVAKWCSPGAVAVGWRFAEEVAYATTVEDARQAAVDAADLAARVSASEAREVGFHARTQSQCQALRDLLNPFYQPPVTPARRTPTVVALATTIYESRDFAKLPDLAALLASHGCDDAELLDHLQAGGPHAGRGCWAVDLVLGKT